MRKALTALAVAATFALATVATPQSAEARNGRKAAAIIGGLAVGALVGAAIASGPHYSGPPRYYAPKRRHSRRHWRRHSRRYYYRPHCWWERERYWNGYRWRRQRVRVCD